MFLTTSLNELRLACSIWFSSLPFQHFHCPWWLLAQPPGAAPVSPPRASAVVQIYLQGTPARSGSTHVPRPQGSTLAAEHGEREEGGKTKGTERNTPKTKIPLHTSGYKSHSPTPFGQTNLKTHSLTRLSLRPLTSVTYILCDIYSM